MCAPPVELLSGSMSADGLFCVPDGKAGAAPVEAMRRYMASLPQDPAPLRQELADRRFWGAVRAEFLATLLLTVLGCGASLRTKAPPAPPHEGGDAAQLRAALAFGAAVATLVRCLGGVSGAHMNPAVTAALLVTRHIGAARGAAYVGAQCAGALAGAAILYGLAPPALRGAAGLGATEPPPWVGGGEAFGLEFLASAVVAITVLASMEPGAEPLGSGALSIGMAYVAGHLLAFPYTGASFNPARSFGPAVVTNTWRLHWVYWVGPVLGGILGGVTYDYTQESRSQTIRRSFRKRRKPPPATSALSRDVSALSANDNTEMTLDHCRL